MRRRWMSRETFRTDGCATLSLLAGLRSGLGAGLAGFLLEHFARPANALMLVRIGRAQGADVGRHLPHLGLVRTGDHQVGLLRHGDLNPLGHGELDRVRISQTEHHVLALHFRTVAHSHDVQFPAEAFRDAEHGIGEERPGEPVQRPVLVGRPRGEQVLVFLLDLNARGHGHPQLPLGSLHLDAIPGDLDLDALGQWNRLAAYARHGCSNLSLTRLRYQTSQRTSPPTPFLRAALPVMTPLGVVMMLTPIPPSTFFTSALPENTRRPGREMRFSPETTLWRSGVYLRNMRSVFLTRFSSATL